MLVADVNMRQTVSALIKRYDALRIKLLTYDIFVHPQRDPGCRVRAQNFLRPFCNQYRYALVLFDYEGCGEEVKAREELEQLVRVNLARDGWGERAEVIVLEPELEIWVWSDSPYVAQALGWEREWGDLRTWLIDAGFLAKGAEKPTRPKESVEAVLKRAYKPRSSSIYFDLASQISLSRCSDPAFGKFRKVLKEWFGQAE